MVEAGDSNDQIEGTHYAGGYVDLFDLFQGLKAELQDRSGQVIGSSADWNITSKPRPGFNNREIRLSRGKYGKSWSIVVYKNLDKDTDTSRFLGGSSGVNGTLCLRGMKEDFDEWGIPGWTGEEFFKYMSKVFLPVIPPVVLADPIFFNRLKPFMASLGFRQTQNMATLARCTLNLMISLQYQSF